MPGIQEAPRQPAAFELWVTPEAHDRFSKELTERSGPREHLNDGVVSLDANVELRTVVVDEEIAVSVLIGSRAGSRLEQVSA